MRFREAVDMTPRRPEAGVDLLAVPGGRRFAEVPPLGLTMPSRARIAASSLSRSALQSRLCSFAYLTFELGMVSKVTSS